MEYIPAGERMHRMQSSFLLGAKQQLHYPFSVRFSMFMIHFIPLHQKQQEITMGRLQEITNRLFD